MPSARIPLPYVFSAQAEVFPSTAVSPAPDMGFLRASGGVSVKRLASVKLCEFSPRKRRCFPKQQQTLIDERVFSAQAEVFPY